MVFTGGTISMLADPDTGAARPVLDGKAILERTPGLDAIAQVEPIDWGLVPASHLRFDQILELSRLLRDALARPEVAGAVLVQGTDVIEETAFCFDLLVDSPKPVVVVGAMRRADEPDYDGPRNLRAAVQAAASAELRDQGTLVVMAGSILPANDVTKTHTSNFEAFKALNLGPVGQVTEGGVRLVSPRTSRPTLGAIPDAAAEPVVLITAVVATNGELVRLAVRGGARGLVVAATGSGNTDPDLLAAARDAMASGVPVVLTTRCGSGTVSPVYGFPGGGAEWIASGAIPAGILGGPKARVALALGLGTGLDDAGLRALFAG
jgi:L-asparaginase